MAVKGAAPPPEADRVMHKVIEEGVNIIGKLGEESQDRITHQVYDQA